MSSTVEWFFGRGLSIGSGLVWGVPPEWHALPRDEQISRIKAAVLSEMGAEHVNTTDIRCFLDMLAKKTVSPWRHQFHTTNWDYLLQREILSLGVTKQPSWCAEMHVYHLNGTVEDLPDNSRRSQFVLESDSPDARISTTEGDVAYNKFIWSQTFVVVGMSFECEVDKYLLKSIGHVEDDLPIGDSHWIVVNPNVDTLAATCARLQTALPGATVIRNASTFGAWLRNRVPELQSRGVIAF